jgi:hypothetical protein
VDEARDTVDAREVVEARGTADFEAPAEDRVDLVEARAGMVAAVLLVYVFRVS